jgi:hypothetical protein
LARYRRDGNIEFLGRIDTQVKIRGFRIEPGEIEAILGQHPAVRETLVLARENDLATSSTNRTDKHLVAYLVAKQEPAPAIHELRNFLKEKLPDYMIPAAFVFLDSLPLTPNGKVDRNALPLPDRDRFELEKLVAPRDETESILCHLWAKVLKIDHVGIDDDFFALGGHSLLAAKLFARLDETFGRSLPLGVLFTAPTVRLLAGQYRTSVHPNGCSVIVPLRTGGTLTPVFAVPGVLGNVLGFADLARDMGPNQPFYGFQSVGLVGREAPLDSIEEMARLYLKEMRSVQPHGPYAILGACFGATVAYEMTRQLLAAREEVGFLGLLDPTRREGKHAGRNPAFAPRVFKRVEAFGSLVRGRLQLYREEMRRLGGKHRINYLASKFHLLRGLMGTNNVFKGMERELNQIEVYRANLLALDRYRREPLTGRLRALEIFETTRRGQANVRDRIDWQALWNGPIKHHNMPGKDSGDMVSGDNARVLSALLAQQLQLALHPRKQP